MRGVARRDPLAALSLVAGAVIKAAPRSRFAAAAVSAALLGLTLWLAAQLILDLRILQQDKTALAELRDVKYGLFNAELWVEQIGEIVGRKIDTFEITPENRPQLERAVERVLERLLIEVEGYLDRRNASGDNWLERVQGGLQQRVQDWLIDFDALRARIPAYADQVLLELEQPRTKAELKSYLSRVLEQAEETSFAQVDYRAFDRILAQYDCSSGVDCVDRLTGRIGALERQSRRNAWAVVGLIAALFAVNVIATRRHRRLFPETLAVMTLAALIALAGGVLTPMLQIEARITELSFQLLGAPVRFTDQVLYFQSKSIMDVVVLLAGTGAADMLLVAGLITLFSLVFPTLKVVATWLHFRARRDPLAQGLWQEVVRFFALRSGKWSMADVLVIAIFMAYIGFDGLIDSQLASLAGDGGARDSGLDLLTTNGTQLGVGFFLFLVFVFGSLIISTLLETEMKQASPADSHSAAR